MSAAVAALSPAPMHRMDRQPSPRSYAHLAPATTSTERLGQSTPPTHDTQYAHTPNTQSPPDGRKSPRSARTNGHPKIIVKKEPPSSPSTATTTTTTNGRHRPRKLDLNTTTNIPGPLSARPPLSASLQDVTLACLSPGFQTQDPSMKEQLKKSVSIRDQQMALIEQRRLKSAKGEHPETARPIENPNPFARAPPPASKKRPPPGLSIITPAAERFANERVIQSAPLGQTFTGINDRPSVMRERHLPPSNMSQPPIHHQPAMQTNQRLPPISDVFGNDQLPRPQFLHTNSTPSVNQGPPLPSPGFPPQTAHPMSYPQGFSERPREYRSAEEAVQELTGGREDLQPRLIRYGKQPPTPPSPPLSQAQQPRYVDHMVTDKYPTNPQQPHSEGAGRRRTRNEYEADSSPPLGNGGDRQAPGMREMFERVAPSLGHGRSSPATQAAKKEEFMSLVSRAWDLFHS